MITLTTAAKISTVLGSSTQTSYDRIELTSIVMDVVNNSISGACQLVSSGTPSAAPVTGTYNIPTAGGAKLTISIPNLPFFASLALTSGQQATVAGWITSTQNTVEAGLVSVGVVNGTQSPGL